MTQWTIQPKYDQIYVKDKDILQGENNGDNILWTMDGKMLFATPKVINPFSNGVATIQNRNSALLDGFVNSRGEYTELHNVEATYGYPYFEDGYLVVKQGGKYALYNKEGKSIELPSLETLYPYSNEFATYYAYQNPEKKKNPFFSLLLSDGNAIKNFVIKDKEKDKTKVIEPKDISFMSSVDVNTGKALAVVKNKLYWFDTFENCLIPIQMEDNNHKNRQLELESNKSLATLEFPCDSLTIVAKCGKDQTIEFRFDKQLRLLPKYVSVSSSNNAVKQYQAPSYPTDITVTKDGNEYGLEFKDQYSLPAQFEKVGLAYGNKALVKIDGNWGVIEIIPDCDYTMQINGDKELLFSHNKAKSTIQIVLPAIYSPDKVKVEAPGSNSLRLDNSSRAEQGNTISYTCILDIPSALPDTIRDISFGPISLRVDGVRQADRMVKAKGKFDNPYSIFFADPNAEVASGKAVFDIMIRDNMEAGLLAAPFEVSIESESLPAMVEKVSDNLYRCTVDNLVSGVNDLTVKVTEKDCPACSFPIKISYTKVGKKETATLRNQTLEDLLNTPKGIVFDDGYFIGDVIADNAPQRAGPGMNFPKSSYIGEELDDPQIWPPYKGQRIKVKEEGDWYLISEDPNRFDPKAQDRRYIPKKYVKPVESTPFVLDQNSNPALYVTVTEDWEGDDFVEYCPNVIAIFPEGLFVVYAEGLWGNSINFGEYSDGDPALILQYTFSGHCNNIMEKVSKPVVNIGQGLEGLDIKIDLPNTYMKTTTYKKKHKVAYPDLTLFSESEWREILEKAKRNEHFNEYGSDIFSSDYDLNRSIITKDELEKKYTKVK